jgi:hypothetical protein
VNRYVTFVNYDEWLAAVDTILHAQKRGIKVTSIDQAALQEAFDNDVSPVVFAQNPLLPIKPWKHDSPGLSESRALPILVAILVILLVGWWAKSYVGVHFRDKAMEAVKYPLKLPVKGENGIYWPEHSREAEDEARSLIKDYLMTPKDATDIEAIASSMPSKRSFQIEGKVSSKNKYGTLITAPFQMTLELVSSALFQGRTEFKIKSLRLQPVGDTNVWSRTDLMPFDQRRAGGAAKKSSSRSVYSRDQD